jgi:hypothetical protein
MQRKLFRNSLGLFWSSIATGAAYARLAVIFKQTSLELNRSNGIVVRLRRLLLSVVDEQRAQYNKGDNQASDDEQSLHAHIRTAPLHPISGRLFPDFVGLISL